MKFYNWKSPQTRDFIVYKSVAVNDLGRTGYIIEAETKTAIKYINKIMGSIQQDGLRSKWITIDQAEHNILFIDNKLDYSEDFVFSNSLSNKVKMT